MTVDAGMGRGRQALALAVVVATALAVAPWLPARIVGVPTVMLQGLPSCVR